MYIPVCMTNLFRTLLYIPYIQGTTVPCDSTSLNIIPVEGNLKVVGMEAGERNNLVTAVVCITAMAN